MNTEKVIVRVKNKEVKGFIVERKLDKFKIQLLDSGGWPTKQDWFENKDFKRVWN